MYKTDVKCNIKKLKQDIELLAKRYPDAIYGVRDEGMADCRYSIGPVENGPATQGCLIGHALRKQPAAFNVAKSWDTAGEVITVGGLFNHDDDPTVKWLERVQDAQDNGETWSEAVERASGEDEDVD